ncbi:unnamed protein product [Soboliphyme baturini]|uniref:Piwi domain-containing protein n=1 Tax=Soboliphyme baturini TaxID=241478 RepID=A0A183IY65_9BILA|nr:unnamed protein product [Soboliphyme baturini]
MLTIGHCNVGTRLFSRRNYDTASAGWIKCIFVTAVLNGEACALPQAHRFREQLHRVVETLRLWRGNRQLPPSRVVVYRSNVDWSNMSLDDAH